MDAHRVAFNTWQEKTEWVQKDKRFDVLLPWGKHRADVLKEYIDHLEARCAALAAENAGLKDAISCHAAGFTVCEACGEENISGNDDVCRALNETPATDAFLAEVRAQGVEMSINRIHETGSLTFGDCYIALNGLVDEILRKGVQS